jgi:hypothetical protein
MTDLQVLLAELQKVQKSLLAKLQAGRSRLLTVDEAAFYLGISAKTLRNGLGPKAAKPFPVRPVKVAGRVVFRRDDLDNYIDSL